MDRLQFSLQDLASVLGLAQCLMILVYMLFRAGGLARALVPIVYFSVLAAAFFSDLAERFIGEALTYYDVLQWLLWFSGPPLSFLLVLQIARLASPPTLRHFTILLLLPAAYGVAVGVVSAIELCSGEVLSACESFRLWLQVAGLGAGALSLLAIWGVRGVIGGVKLQKMGQERFWLILTLVGMNILFLGLVLGGLSGALDEDESRSIRTLVGMGFAYVAGTSLFRIYPPAVRLVGDSPMALSVAEREVAARIERLMDLEKIYHEPAYSRADLARELKVPEAGISRIVNLHFGKSLTQLLNERRVADAKRLLAQTLAPVRTVAEESGFNSLASFNRVFKEIEGRPPGTYRQAAKQALKTSERVLNSSE